MIRFEQRGGRHCMKQSMNKLVWAMALWVLAASGAQAQVAVPGAQRSRMPATLDVARGDSRQAGTQPEMDMNALKTQLEAFQAVVNRDISQAFAQPFVLLQDTQGTYLPRFGVVFHLEVNLHPLRLLNVFGPRPYTEEELQKTREAKLEKVRELKTRLSTLLLEHGADLAEAMPADQNVAVVVHLFNMPSEKGEGLPTQLVMEISRKALVEAQAQQTPLAEFEKQQAFLEF
jgi:hypothetical protein